MKTTENIKNQIGSTVDIKWGTSRGRDSYGYTKCSLYHNGRKVAACNGGGYDMRGTVIGNWLAATFRAELLKLKPHHMPSHSHWEPERHRVCDGQCHEAHLEAIGEAILTGGTQPGETKLPEDCFECPTCKGATRQTRDGKRVETGRYFYGLRFYNPSYDVLDEKLDRCDDTFTKPSDVGKTFRQLQKEGKIVDLDILRKWHCNTSKVPTRKHTVPCIDGACGESSVMQIANAIGIGLKKVCDLKKLDVYEVVKVKQPRKQRGQVAA